MVGLLALIQRCPDLCTVTLPMSLDFGPPSSPAVVAPKQQAALRSYLQRLKQRYQRLKAMAKRKTIEGAVPPIVEVGDALMKDDDHLLTSSVTFLNVAYSPDPGNIANAARFFREVFPRLKDLRYEVMWTHSGAPDEPGEREQRRKDRWVGVRRALGFEGDGAQPHPNWVPVSWE
ncbi:hypothetical protein CALVIDRAFT_526780 [Calocera viscosa TUFC12733]|uniref:Uncharacterized protein n=1 Tax=Calocera viscosa (strain TUFC12733) TaxID=1330018 RepID=A0A167N0P6_CALVF|nr:hypothetical protein CALVIDRAFT_526780 [Calocera viscosa TUFC12733]